MIEARDFPSLKTIFGTKAPTPEGRYLALLNNSQRSLLAISKAEKRKTANLCICLMLYGYVLLWELSKNNSKSSTQPQICPLHAPIAFGAFNLQILTFHGLKNGIIVPRKTKFLLSIHEAYLQNGIRN